jgi:hypothetical protein
MYPRKRIIVIVALVLPNKADEHLVFTERQDTPAARSHLQPAFSRAIRTTSFAEAPALLQSKLTSCILTTGMTNTPR